MSNRRTSKRLLTRTLIISLLLALVLVAVAPAAFAQGPPPCKKAGCNSLSPQTTHCNKGAITIATVYGDHHKVELRYSPWCKAYWSRAKSTLAPGDIMYTEAWIMGHKPATDVFGGPQAISKMWWPKHRACGVSVAPWDPGNMPSNWVCTP